MSLAAEVRWRQRSHLPAFSRGRNQHAIRRATLAQGWRRKSRTRTRRRDSLARQSGQQDRIRRHGRPATGDSVGARDESARRCDRISFAGIHQRSRRDSTDSRTASKSNGISVGRNRRIPTWVPENSVFMSKQTLKKKHPWSKPNRPKQKTVGLCQEKCSRGFATFRIQS